MTNKKPTKKVVAEVNPVVKAAADQTVKRKRSAVQLELFPLTTFTRRTKQ